MCIQNITSETKCKCLITYTIINNMNYQNQSYKTFCRVLYSIQMACNCCNYILGLGDHIGMT